MTTQRPGVSPRASIPPSATPSLPPAATAPTLRSAAAPTRANRRGLLLSILVVLLGGLLAASGVRMLTTAPTVLVVARPVPLGAVITDADVTTSAGTNDPKVSSVRVERRSDVVGKVALVPLSKGQLLTLAQVGDSDGFAKGQLLVALALKPGQLPARGLVAGDKVLIVSTSGIGGAGASAVDPSRAPGAAQPAIEATVAAASTKDQATNVSIVDVRVAAADGRAVAEISSTGNVAVLLRPVGE